MVLYSASTDKIYTTNHKVKTILTECLEQRGKLPEQNRTEHDMVSWKSILEHYNSKLYLEWVCPISSINNNIKVFPKENPGLPGVFR